MISLIGKWPIGGRCAADYGGYVNIFETQAVVAVLARRLVGIPRPVERGVKPITRSIAGEHTTRSVGSVGGGSKSNNRYAGFYIAESVKRASPIALPLVAAGRICGPLLSPLD